jgi:hypothetical protein
MESVRTKLKNRANYCSQFQYFEKSYKIRKNTIKTRENSKHSGEDFFFKLMFAWLKFKLNQIYENGSTWLTTQKSYFYSDSFFFEIRSIYRPRSNYRPVRSNFGFHEFSCCFRVQNEFQPIFTEFYEGSLTSDFFSPSPVLLTLVVVTGVCRHRHGANVWICEMLAACNFSH